MAATEKRSRNQIEISAIDADWTASSYLYVNSISFEPGAAGDYLTIKESVDSGPDIVPKMYSVDGSSLVHLFRETRMKPMIDYSECTLSAGHKVIITLSDK